MRRAGYLRCMCSCPRAENWEIGCAAAGNGTDKADNVLQIECEPCEAIQCRCAKADELRCSSRLNGATCVGVSLVYKLEIDVAKSAHLESDSKREWTMQHTATRARCYD